MISGERTSGQTRPGARLRCRTVSGLFLGRRLLWSYPGLADGLSVAIQSAARATSLEVFSKFIGERYPSAECSPMEVVPALDVLKYGHPGFGLCAVVSVIQAFAFKPGGE